MTPNISLNARALVGEYTIKFNENLKFTNRIINEVDENISALVKNGVALLSPEDETLDGRLLTINGEKVLNFITNSCLGLETDLRIKDGIIDSVHRYGASFIVSRIFASAPQFKEFERLLEQIFSSYPLIVPSTTLGHLCAFPVIFQRHDLLILDKFVHNSVQMATKIVSSWVKIKTIAHNDMESLNQVIDAAHNDPKINNIWYLTDGINSVSGAYCPINELNNLLEKYDKFYTYIDDAHGMSVYGKNGCGYVLSHFTQQPEKMIVAVSLSKSFGIGGGGTLIFPKKEWRRKVRHCGPTWIYSSPISPPILGAGIASAKIHLSPEIEKLQQRLRELINLFRKLASEKGLALMNSNSATMNFIKIGTQEKTIRIVQELLMNGFLVNPFVFPAVKTESAGLRIVITLHCTETDISNLVDNIAAVMRQYS